MSTEPPSLQPGVYEVDDEGNLTRVPDADAD